MRTMIEKVPESLYSLGSENGFLPFTIAADLEPFLSVLVSKVPMHTQNINASYPKDHSFSGWKMLPAAVCSPSCIQKLLCSAQYCFFKSGVSQYVKIIQKQS